MLAARKITSMALLSLAPIALELLTIAFNVNLDYTNVIVLG